MSGHSKWATIKRKKGLTDAKRGQTFTKLSNAITIAVKQGGGNSDINFNASLRLAIDKAKSANMPKDSIDRAMQKGEGGAGGVELEEALYEGFGPGGVGILIETVTDKKQRTVSEVKNLIEKNGGTMAGQGAVSYLFHKTGEIIVDTKGKTSDEILQVALDNNIEDVEEDEGSAFLYVAVNQLQNAKKGIEAIGLTIEESGLVYRPIIRIETSPEITEKALSLVEKLEELDDVQKVYTNL